MRASIIIISLADVNRNVVHNTSLLVNERMQSRIFDSISIDSLDWGFVVGVRRDRSASLSISIGRAGEPSCIVEKKRLV